MADAHVKEQILKEFINYLGQDTGLFLFDKLFAPHSKFMLTGSMLLKILTGGTWKVNSVDLLYSKHHNMSDDDMWDDNLDGVCYLGKGPFKEFATELKTLDRRMDLFIDDKSLGIYSWYTPWSSSPKIQILIPSTKGLVQHVRGFDLDFCKNVYWQGHLYTMYPDAVIHKTSTFNLNEYFLWNFRTKHVGNAFYISGISTGAAKWLEKYRARGFKIVVVSNNQDLVSRVMEKYHLEHVDACKIVNEWIERTKDLAQRVN